MTATLLPNAKQQFLDTNGRPLAGGQVYFYIPNTSTLKNTWQDAGQTVLNTNPVVLDANGQAIIYGNGQYREVVYDVHGNLIWDQLTSAPISQADLASTTDPTNGAGAVGFNYSLSYAAGTIGKWLKDLANSSGSSFIGFIQAGVNAVARTLQSKARERVTPQDFGAVGDGSTDDTAAIQAALNSGAIRICGCGLPYKVTALTVPGGVVFDGEGGELITVGNTSQSVVITGGAAATIENWYIHSDVAGTRKGKYGVEVAHSDTILRHLRFKDISFSGVFNEAANTDGFDIFAQNCGWDAISNFTGTVRPRWRKVVAIGCGRSLLSTDPGATGVMLDGWIAIDNGLDAIADQHKDTIHFEYATDCIVRNGVVWYTSSYTGGTIPQTWAILRWNASTNCRVEGVQMKIESTVNNRLILGLIDTSNGGLDGNTLCSAENINVNANAIPAYNLQFLSYDGNARFRLNQGLWFGNITISSAVAPGNAFENIADIDVAGPGSGTFLSSSYITADWTIERIKMRGYATAFNLNGFQGSSIRDCEIEGAVTCAFMLLNSNAAVGYQPDGGAVKNNILRGTTGTVLQTNNQQTRSLTFSGNVIDGSAVTGLLTTGGTAGATTSSVKAIGNLVGGALTTVQTGTNTPGALNANMNNL
jgi:hypothetical protein